jgi:signal transduction histidine kinase
VLSAGLAIERCRAEVASTTALATQLECARQLTRSALDQLRSSIQALSDGRADQDEDLTAMLDRLRTLRAMSDFHVAVRIRGRRRPLVPGAKRALFRIASECLFNTAVHAAARRAVVSLHYGVDSLRLAVADDGTGDPEVLRRLFRQEVPGTGGGYHRGLADIAARVAELGGRLTVARSGLGGVRVDVLVPLSAVTDPAVAGPDPSTAPGGCDG